MKDFSKVILDSKKRKIFFKGRCLEVLDLCQAMCCRKWDVYISDAELQSNLYKARVDCALIRKDCRNKKISCVNRISILQKKEDDACIYLNSQNKCSIYEHRPLACSTFTCKKGWVISTVMQGEPPKFKKTLKQIYFTQRLKDDMQFILHPLTGLKTLFYLKEKGLITFVKKMVNKCGLITSKASFHHPALNDDNLLYLINLFDGQNTLKDIRQSVNKKYNLNLSKEDFYEILWLLSSHNIIIFKNQN